MPRVILISIDGLAGFYWSDPRARMPTLRRLAERGSLGERMEGVCPSTTWPAHVTLVTGVSPGRHGVVGNRILDRVTGELEDLTGDPIHDAGDLLRAPTIYDVASVTGLTTAAIDWPATRNSPSLNFNLPFFKDQDIFEAHTPRPVWRELAALGFPIERQGEWAQLSKRFLKDAMVADLAAHVFRRHAPQVMLVHFLSTDSFQHLYGPRSPEAYWAIDYVDERVGRLLAALPAGELDERTTLFVVSDHGFLPVEREIRVNVLLGRLGLVPSAVRFAMNHGAGYVYLMDPDPERLARLLVPELARVEGVARVWTAADYPALGLGSLRQNPHLPDFLLEAAEGYCFVEEASGEDAVAPSTLYRGTHGQTPGHPDNAAFFLAVGPGIRRGARLATITSRDVAPTIAHILGLELPAAEGRLLGEIFR